MNRNGWSDTQLMVAMNAAVGCMREEYGHTLEELRRAKFTRLGGGHYGSAWTRDDMSGYVIKISGANPNDSFPAYVYWAMANPMPCIPEYRMPVFSNDREQFMVMMPAYKDNSVVLDYDEDFKAAQSFLYGGSDPRTDLQRACHEISKFFYGKVQFDLHSENAMWDEVKGEYVITDPIHQGDTDSLVGELTGKKFQPMPQLEHQLGLDLPRTSASFLAAKPEFEKLWTSPFFPRPQRGAQKLNDLKPIQMMQFAPLKITGAKLVNLNNIDWVDIGRRLMDLEVHNIPKRLDAVVRDPIGLAAQWVRERGLTPQQAEKIGSIAQEWTDERLAGWPSPNVEFCLAPTLPSFVCRPVEAGIPSAAIAIKHVVVPVDVLRILRDQWKIHARQPHLDPRRQHKFNREFMLDRR